MEYLGLIFEIVFLGLGIYVYLFSRGLAMPSNPKTRASAEKFRQANAGWMRILSLLLIAVMTVNIIVHVRDLMA